MADPAFSELAGKRGQRWQDSLNAALDYPPGGRAAAGGGLSFGQNNASRTSCTRNWMVAGNANWDAMGDGRCMWTFNASRAPQESTFANNRFYIANNLGLNVVHKFPYKLTGRLNLGWQIDKYPESTAFSSTSSANRRDDTYTQGVGVDYALQAWIALSLDYKHQQRFSIASGSFNYNDHQTTLGAKLMF